MNRLGVGINYRKEIADFILENISSIDFIEVNTERFFIQETDAKLEEITSRLPCVLHGLSLSLGDVDEIADSYFDNLSKTIEKTNCQWFSEHIAATKVKGIEVRNLMPVPFTEEVAKRIAKKINQISSITNKPFIIENVTYYYPMPGSKLSEIDFINLILDEANCGLLLDLNNLYCNSENHQYDPLAFIDKLPKNRVVEIHMAGGAKIHDMQVDTHATKISEDVYKLFEYCSESIPFKGAVLERDSGPDNFLDMIDEIKTMQSILKKTKVEV